MNENKGRLIKLNQKTYNTTNNMILAESNFLMNNNTYRVIWDVKRFLMFSLGDIF
jgi:hypothetical protein